MKRSKRRFISEKVKSPSNVVICLVLVAIVGLLVVGALVGMIYSVQYEESDMALAEVSFNDWHLSADERDLELFSDDFEDKFIINDFEKYINDTEKLKSRCDGSEIFKVWYLHKKSENSKPKNEIYQISDGEKVIYSFEDMRNAKKEYLKPIIIFFSIFLCFILVLIVIMLSIAHRPEKFSYKFIRLIFKPGVI